VPTGAPGTTPGGDATIFRGPTLARSTFGTHLVLNVNLAHARVPRPVAKALKRRVAP